MSTISILLENEAVVGEIIQGGAITIILVIVLLFGFRYMGIQQKAMFKMQSDHNASIIKTFDKGMNDITDSIKRMVYYMGRAVLDSHQTITIFKAIMDQHIYRKLSFFSQIFETNNLKEREIQIKKNIASEIERITSDEAMILSEFNSKAGDLGSFLKSVDLCEFTNACYDIVFGTQDRPAKLRDLKGLMISYKNDLVEQVEKAVRKNTI